MAPPPDKQLMGLLKDVSRSFYLTLRVLPGTIRPQIGLAYLLARTTDTIADTDFVPPDQRLGALDQLRRRILGTRSDALDFAAFTQRQGAPAEGRILELCETSLAWLQALPAPDRLLVREVLTTITSGQELDLRRFACAPAGRLVALRTPAELDDYTYRVAGCVGEFWTKMCRAHVFPKAKLDDALLLAQGVRFGKGLQLVNVLRDLPADLRQGRCYLPAEQFPAGLTPEDLLEPANEIRLRPLYDSWLDQAQAHLAAGWDYTNALPRVCVRVRLACAWPLLLGFETLKLLRTGKALDPRHRIKVSRAQLKRIMARSILCYPWPAAWKRLATA